MLQYRRRQDSNTRPSNIKNNNLVAPTGFDRDASAFKLKFEGLALAV
jgi:hypothetical protein